MKNNETVGRRRTRRQVLISALHFMVKQNKKREKNKMAITSRLSPYILFCFKCLCVCAPLKVENVCCIKYVRVSVSGNFSLKERNPRAHVQETLPFFSLLLSCI